MKIVQRLKLIIVIVMLCCICSPAFADDIYTGLLSDKALNGYDTVAYFTAGKPVKGKREFSTEYKGVIWLFSSEQNKQLFLKAPETYRPQYGGYCAWAVSAKQSKAPGNPEYWKIVDNKLYLNYNEKVQLDWLADMQMHIRNADKFWPDVKGN